MRAKRIDTNQNQVVKNLRQLGISVAITSMLGKGFPDLVIGYKKRNYLIELKDGKKAKSQKKLTECEEEFFNAWKGQINVCENIDDILKLLK